MPGPLPGSPHTPPPNPFPSNPSSLRCLLKCHIVLDQIFVSHQIHMLTLKVVAFGREAFGRRLGLESRALLNETSALIKETLEDSLAPSTTWGHRKKTAICEPESRLSPDTESFSTLIVGLPASRSVRNKFLLLINHLIYDILL